MVVWSDGLNGSWRVSGKAILRAMHVVVAEGPGRLLTNSPGWDFISELEVLHVQAAMKQVDKIRKVMLDFIVSTKNVIFSDLTHWLMTHWLTWLVKHPFSPFSPIYLFIKFGWAPSGLQNRLLSRESVLLNVGRNWQVDQNSKQWVRYFHVFRKVYAENPMFKGFAQLTSGE